MLYQIFDFFKKSVDLSDMAAQARAARYKPVFMRVIYTAQVVGRFRCSLCDKSEEFILTNPAKV